MIPGLTRQSSQEIGQFLILALSPHLCSGTCAVLQILGLTPEEMDRLKG